MQISNRKGTLSIDYKFVHETDLGLDILLKTINFEIVLIVNRRKLIYYDFKMVQTLFCVV